MLRREEPRVARANFWLSEQALTTSPLDYWTTLAGHHLWSFFIYI